MIICHMTCVKLVRHMSNLQDKFLTYMSHGQLIIQVAIMCNIRPTCWSSFQLINHLQIHVKLNLHLRRLLTSY